jgi:hypothetical protein
VPLSEEEQRILQEMEQKLREHDRDFVDRVSHAAHRGSRSHPLRWPVIGFLLGTALLLGTFRASTVLAVCGVLVMLVCALVFAQGFETAPDSTNPRASRTAGSEMALRGEKREAPQAHQTASNQEWSEMRRRIRSRFGHRD